jgi:hypothetical protein
MTVSRETFDGAARRRNETGAENIAAPVAYEPCVSAP